MVVEMDLPREQRYYFISLFTFFHIVVGRYYNHLSLISWFVLLNALYTYANKSSTLDPKYEVNFFSVDEC